MEKMNHPTLTNGKISYIEIPAIDIRLSASFYKSVFGWNIRERGANLAFDDTANGVSGTWVVNRKATTQTAILIYIMVDNISLTVKAIHAKGGKIVQEIGIDAPELTARFSDPAGNVFGIFVDH